VSGFYRYARNPMYVAVAALIFGQAVLFASSGVAVYGVVIVGAFDSFVRLYEEPTLRETYGESYEVYRTAVPRWIRGSAVRAGGLGRTLVRSTRVERLRRRREHPRVLGPDDARHVWTGLGRVGFREALLRSWIVRLPKDDDRSGTGEVTR
jgi:hypothetical protein